MLCTKIIFTNEGMSDIGNLSNFMKRSGIKHKTYDDKERTEVEADVDDEGLYELCCELSRYILDKCIKKAILKFLDIEYACFNSDECKIICCNVFRRDFVSELPGRIYIYLKINRSVNPYGFYHFMCRDISNEALRLASEEADRILAMNNNSDFIELLKCFSAVSMDSAESVELTCDNTGIHITSCSPHFGDCLTEYASDEADVLAELVTLNPKRIDVLGKDNFLRNDISAVITAVFEDRIQYK